LKAEIVKLTALLFGLIFVFTLFTQSAAAVVWSDNFDDGNYNGWTVIEGHWQVTDGYLEDYYVDEFIYMIWHDSSQVVGTWSFDLYQSGTGDNARSICLFMANETDDYNYYGYGLRITETSVLLMKQEGQRITAETLSFVVFEDFLNTWTHFDVTRNSTGGLHVYVNATSTTTEPDITVVDTEYSYSERFVWYALGIFVHIDNITVDNEILITPPEPTTTTTETTTTSDTTTTDGTALPIDTTLLIAGAGVVGVIIIAAVVFTRRR